MKEEKGYSLDNPAKSSPQGRKKSPERILQEKREKKRRKSKRWGVLITVLQGLLSVAFMGMLFIVDVLPFKYTVLALAVFVVLFAITHTTQKHRKLQAFGKFLGVLVSIILVAGTYGLVVANMALNSVVDGKEKKNDAIVAVTQGGFHVYINDNGKYKIATVNPETHQILVTTTPAEYYITIPGVSEGKKDILKNAENYGTDVVMNTLGALYETEIPFYANTNLANLRELLKDFTPDMVVRPDKLIGSVDENMETNLSRRQMQQLMKLYLGEDADWEVYSISAGGTNSSNYTYSAPKEVSFVVEPDKESISRIIDLMNRMKDGERLKKSDFSK